LRFLFYLSYLVISYKFFKPYQKFLEIDCTFSNNLSIVVLTAKQNIKNITVSDVDFKNKCAINYLSKDSMDICKIKNEKLGNKVFIRVVFNANNETYTAIKECKVESKRKSLLDLIIRR